MREFSCKVRVSRFWGKKCQGLLLEGCKNVLAGGKTSLTPSVLQQGLAEIDNSHTIQDISGKIAFGSDDDPVDKAIFILSIDSDDHVRIAKKNRIQGCLLAGQCNP